MYNRRTALKFLTKIKGYKHFGYFCSMKWFRSIFDFYLDASVHVALAILSLLMITCMTLNIPVDFHLALFLFFGSIPSYNFVKYGVEAEKYLKLNNSYHKGIQLFSFVSLLFAGYHAHLIGRETLLRVVILVLLTGLYALPLLPKSRNLRSLSGLKVFIVAAVWAGATVWLPVVENGSVFSWDIGIESAQRLLLVLVLLMPFEIRDVKYDAPELRTLPQRFGVKNAKFFGMLLVILFFLITFLKDDIFVLEIVEKGILGVLLALTLWVTKEKQFKYFASFWVEGIPILWLGIVFSFKSLY